MAHSRSFTRNQRPSASTWAMPTAASSKLARRRASSASRLIASRRARDSLTAASTRASNSREPNGFTDVVVGAGLQSVNGRASSPARAERRMIGNNAVRSSRRSRVTRREAVKLRHHRVRQRQGRGGLAKQAASAWFAVRHGPDLISRLVQQTADMSAHISVIVGEQDAWTGCRRHQHRRRCGRPRSPLDPRRLLRRDSGSQLKASTMNASAWYPDLGNDEFLIRWPPAVDPPGRE